MVYKSEREKLSKLFNDEDHLQVDPCAIILMGRSRGAHSLANPNIKECNKKILYYQIELIRSCIPNQSLSTTDIV